MSSFPEFKNEPLTDFTKPENKSAMEAALQKVEQELGRDYPLVIGGERITGLPTFQSINPSRKSQLLGRFSKGKAEHVEKAVDAASKLETEPGIKDHDKVRAFVAAAR